MKALALDTAHTRIIISAKDDDRLVSLTLDIGMRQSEKLLPSIDFVLNQLDIKPSELDYLTLTKGPGSFTGLRLAFAALKAIEFSCGTPLYGISTLDLYMNPYISMDCPVISVIDAHKDRFYAKIVKNGSTMLEAGDYEISEIAEAFKGEKKVFACGLDSGIFLQNARNVMQDTVIIEAGSKTYSADSIFEITEQMIKDGKSPLQDYDGPEYLRVSEAEQNLENGKIK